MANFDTAVDAAFEPLRGRPSIDRAAALISNLADYGFVWGVLAAFCTAVVLSESDAQAAVYVGFAGAVAASRVHLRAHHPSDVVGGAAIGSTLGLLLRLVLNLAVPSSYRPRTPKGMGPQGYVLKRL